MGEADVQRRAVGVGEDGDRADPHLVAGAMQAQGEVTGLGVTTSYEGTPYAPYVERLRERGIDIKASES